MRPFVAVCALMGLLAGCGKRTPTSVEIDPALARLVPADTVALVGVKVAAVRATPLYQKYAAGRLAPFKAGEDVSEVLAVSDGQRLTVFTKGKSGISQFDETGKKSNPVSRTGGVPAALKAKMRAIPAQSQIWGAGIGAPTLPAELPLQGNLANLRNVIAALESWTAAVDLRSGLKAEANAVYRTEQNAKQIHDALRGLIGLGRLSTPDNAPELLRIYDGIQVSTEKNSVRLRVDIPADVLEKSLHKTGTGS